MYQIGEIINNLEVIDKELLKVHRNRAWYYKTKCIKCGTIITKGKQYFKFGCWFCNKRIPDEHLRNIFYQMKKRCYTNCKNHKYWCGKGIKICDEWLHDPLIFYGWSLNNGYKKGLSIDRIDSDKNYCPENCQWITRNENSKKAIHKKI